MKNSRTSSSHSFSVQVTERAKDNPPPPPLTATKSIPQKYAQNGVEETSLIGNMMRVAEEAKNKVTAYSRFHVLTCAGAF